MKKNLRTFLNNTCVREKPSPVSKVLGRVDSNVKVEIVGYENGYNKIQVFLKGEKVIGYVNSYMLMVDPDEIR